MANVDRALDTTFGRVFTSTFLPITRSPSEAGSARMLREAKAVFDIIRDVWTTHEMHEGELLVIVDDRAGKEHVSAELSLRGVIHPGIWNNSAGRERDLSETTNGMFISGPLSGEHRVSSTRASVPMDPRRSMELERANRVDRSLHVLRGIRPLLNFLCETAERAVRHDDPHRPMS